MQKTVLQTEYHDFKLYYLKKDKARGGQISKSGEYEPFEIKTLLKLIKPGEVVVDIGANIGVYTLPISRTVGIRGIVYAFEPEADNRHLLVQNLMANHVVNVVISSIVLAQKQESMRLYISDTNTGDRHPKPEKDKKRKGIVISTDTLDHQLLTVLGESRPVRLIKSDTQGMEPYVVAGAKSIIEKQKPVIFLEYWPWGFSRYEADKEEMLRFLLSVYRIMYLIDEKRRKLIPVDQPLIDNYCQAHRGHTHCNLAFLP